MITTKRALIWAVLTYFGSFVIGMIYSLITGYDPSQSVEQPLSFCLTIIAGSVVMALVGSYFYFTYKNKIKASLNDGLKFGVTLMIVGFVLDALLFIPYVLSQGKADMIFSYYGKWYFWFALAGVVLVSGAVGHYLAKNPKR